MTYFSRLLMCGGLLCLSAASLFPAAAARQATSSRFKAAYDKVPTHQKTLALGLLLLSGGITINALWGDKQSELKQRVQALKRQNKGKHNKKIQALIRKLQWGRAGHIGLQVVSSVMDVAGLTALGMAWNQWQAKKYADAMSGFSDVPHGDGSGHRSGSSSAATAARGGVVVDSSLTRQNRQPASSYNWGDGQPLGRSQP